MRTAPAPHDIVATADGKIYGRTSAGGAANLGTVFVLDTSTGAEKVLHSFAGGSDGSAPVGRPALQGGLIFGATSAGGASNSGTVFEINPATGAEKVIHNFAVPPGAGLLAYGKGALRRLRLRRQDECRHAVPY